MIVSSSELKRALGLVMLAIPRTSIMPIQTEARFTVIGETLTIEGGSFSQAIKTEVKVMSKEDMQFCVPANDLSRALSKVEGNISVTQKQGATVWKTDLSQFSLPGENPEDHMGFPSLGDMHDVPVFDTSYLRVAASFSSTDTMKDIFGCHLQYTDGNLRIVGTDAHKFSSVLLDVEPGLKEEYVIEPGLARLVPKVVPDPEEMLTDKTKMVFRQENTYLSVVLSDKNYPETESTIPKNNPHLLKVDRDDMVRAVEFVGTMADQDKPIIHVDLVGQMAHISGEDVPRKKAGKRSVSTIYEGIDMKIGFQWHLLSHTLKYVNETAHIQVKNPNTGIVITDPEQPEYTFLVMPTVLVASPKE